MALSRRSLLRAAAAWAPLALLRPFAPAAARASAGDPLVIAAEGVARASVWTAADAGPWEARAASDLARYIGLMTAARVETVVGTPPPDVPAILVGQVALASYPGLGAALRSAAKPDPIVRADAIAVRRAGRHLLVAGSNDESHYFAASWLLQHWGCRWYMPTEFGEHVPRHPMLAIAALDHVHAPPFEVRHYWVAWNGDTSGAEEFQRRNFMSSATIPGAAQVLDRYTADLAPSGGSHFNVPFADPATAEHVAAQVEPDYAAGRDISLAIADGVYENEDPRDRALVTEHDPAMLRPSLTDAMLTLYNNVARILRERYPTSRSRIGGLAYANATLPPRIVRALEPSVAMWLAPIDIDPNHAMDDPRSPPRRHYGEMVRRWSRVTEGRLAIYDYDQGMLVWRDLPNPSHHVFAREVGLYHNSGILGFGTESRAAFATTFLNLFFRGQLMWDPEADTGALLDRFYEDFYGPAATEMARYWDIIFRAWEETGVTEHEYFVIPAIYTPALVGALAPHLERAEAIVRRSRRVGDSLLSQRMRFTRLSFEIIANYVEMVRRAAAEIDYAAAAAAGERALAARLELARMSPISTTRVIGPAAETAEAGPAWFPGEVRQMRELAALTDGTRGRLLAKLPLRWAFRVAEPLPPGWTYSGPEGAESVSDARFAEPELDEADGWAPVGTDLYLQAQGLTAPDGEAPLGHYWYRAAIELGARETRGPARLMFPGLFNEAWLYVNGAFVAHRPFREPWWQSDYRFEWDVEVTPRLRPGRNVIALRGFNPHHFAGMFRRPFLYRPAPGAS